ncbi:hypothetical protein BJY00DRAFT_313909 [Aspergillus carlsbadensis]|nr:hypothetical protein BJY00DRAFT_313909 [Aspergillus carlsbadensis]
MPHQDSLSSGKEEMVVCYNVSDSESSSGSSAPGRFSGVGHGPWANGLKADLLGFLNDIESPGSFFTNQVLHAAVNPGLDVPGVGQVSLPVTPDVAKSIAAACHASPYGKGSETLIDESVRKTSELDASQFSLRNPTWEFQLNAILSRIIPALGVDASPREVEADLYKLLLYEEGAFFLPHQDSEKVEGMFGTLVICLPSKHKGGDVIAHHKDEARIHDSAANSEYGFSYAAWYSDVRHQVKPVTAGYRLVLTYNLIHRPSTLALKRRDGLSKRLGNRLASWADRCEVQARDFDSSGVPMASRFTAAVWKACPPLLIHVLEHEYSSAELSMTTLKGADKGRVETLEEACEDRGFELLLCTVEKTVSGGAEEDDDGYYGYNDYRRRSSKAFHEIQDIIDTSFRLTNVSNVDEDKMIDEVEIDENLVLDDEIFDGDPDDEAYQGYTGNAGAEATHFYRKAAVVIVPAVFMNALMFHAMETGKLETPFFLAHLRGEVTKYPSDQNLRDQLFQLCQKIVASYRTNGMLLDAVADIAFSHRNWDIFKSCVQKSSIDFGPKFGEAIYNHGLTDFVSVLEDLWMIPSTTGFYPTKLLISITATHSRFCTDNSRPVSEEFLAWEKSAFNILLHQVLEQRDLDETTGQSFMATLLKMKIQDALQSIVPQVAATAALNTGFAIGFLDALYSATNKSTVFSYDEIKAAYQTVLEAAVNKFKIQKPWKAQPQQQYTYTMYSRPVSQPDPYINPRTVANVVRNCHAMELDVTRTLKAILAAVSTVHGKEAERVFTLFTSPLVQSLCEYLQGRVSDGATAGGAETSFIVSVLETPLAHYVRPAPQHPTTWKRTSPVRTRCCSDCTTLKIFIEDPERSVWMFSAAEYRRKHLSSQLDRSFETDTIRGGSPLTLQVRKTNRQYEDATREWRKKLSEITGGLNDLEKSSALVKVIGQDAYNNILTHNNLRPAATAPPIASSSAPSAAQTIPGRPYLTPQRPSAVQASQAPSSASLNTLPNPTAPPPATGSGIPKKRSFVDLTD